MIKARSIDELIRSLDSNGYNTEMLSNALGKVLSGDKGENDIFTTINRTYCEGFAFGIMSGLVTVGIIDVLTYAYCFEEITGRKRECTH